MKQVLSKLNAARKLFHAKQHTKSGHNEFSKYFYFEKSDFMPDVLDAFEQVGLSGVCTFTTEQAVLRISDLESEEAISITMPMSTAKLTACHEVQNLGAVISYLGRYLWSSAIELIEGDQVDGSAGPAPKASASDEPLPARPARNEATSTPTPAADQHIWDTSIKSIVIKSTKKGNPYAMLSLANGEKISVFDRKDYENFQEGDAVRLIVKQDGKYWNYVGVEEAAETRTKATFRAGHPKKSFAPKPNGGETLEFVSTVLDVSEEIKGEGAEAKTYYSIEFGNGEIAWTLDRDLAGAAYEFVPDAGETARDVLAKCKRSSTGKTLYVDSIHDAWKGDEHAASA